MTMHKERWHSQIICVKKKREREDDSPAFVDATIQGLEVHKKEQGKTEVQTEK